MKGEQLLSLQRALRKMKPVPFAVQPITGTGTAAGGGRGADMERWFEECQERLEAAQRRYRDAEGVCLVLEEQLKGIPSGGRFRKNWTRPGKASALLPAAGGHAVP